MCPLCSLASKLSRTWSSQIHDSEQEDRQRLCGQREPGLRAASCLSPLAKASQMAKVKIKVCGMGK